MLALTAPYRRQGPGRHCDRAQHKAAVRFKDREPGGYVHLHAPQLRRGDWRTTGTDRKAPDTTTLHTPSSWRHGCRRCDQCTPKRTAAPERRTQMWTGEQEGKGVAD